MEENNQELLPSVKEKFSTIKLEHDGFKLNQKERELALAMLMRPYTKESVTTIAQRFGMSRVGVYEVIKKSNGEFERFQAQLYDDMFQDLYGKAVFVLHEVLATAPTSQKLKAIQMILQASGKLKGETTLTLAPTRNITLEELQKEAEVLEMERELLGGE